MTAHKQRMRAVRTAAKFLYCVAHGAPTQPRDFKTMADLLWLSLPMRERMGRAELDEIRRKPWFIPVLPPAQIDNKTRAAGEGTDHDDAA